MFYCLLINDGYIVGTASSETPLPNGITESEAEIIKNRFMQKPTPPEGYTYMLRASDLEWELVELPPESEPDVDPAEAMEILFGGDGE